MERTLDEGTGGPKTTREIDIHQFASKHLSGENQDLYEDMIVTLCRLKRDDAGRGEVKLLHKAVQELRYGFKVFAPYRDVRKISIFGSSRTPEDDPDYIQAVEFARRMRESGWMVITGAGDGIMKAGHGGAGPEASFGVAIRLPFEQRTNDIIENDKKLVNFRYFFTRKVMFIKEASAVALFPGGYGTQDECFEALVLIQTGKSPIVPVVMVEKKGGHYWRDWLEYVKVQLLSTRLISPHDMDLFLITDDAEAAVGEVLKFYRNYHSMRFVDDDLVMRLNKAPSARLLDQMNGEYKDILHAGRFEVCGPLPEENGELPDKARIRFNYDKRSVGRLRLLINAINAE